MDSSFLGGSSSNLGKTGRIGLLNVAVFATHLEYLMFESEINEAIISLYICTRECPDEI